VTSVTGYSNFDRVNSEDSDGTPLVMLDSAFSDDIDSFSQEIRVSKSSDIGLDWVIGGFFSDDEIDGDILQALDQHFFLTRVDTNWTQQSNSAAAFAHVDIPVTDRLSIVSGARYTHEKKKFRYDAVDLNTFGTSQFLPTPVAGVDDSISNNQFSGQIGLDFNITDDILTYISYNRGFKSGGYKAAIAFSLPELEPFKEEILDAYEIGLKSTFANGRVRFNAAAYYYDWQDFQAFVTEVRSGINVIVLDNAGDAEVKGVEAELSLHPVDGLDLQLGANLMDTEITKYNTIPGTADADGNRLANSPKVMFNGRVRYEFPIGSSGLRAYILSDVAYRSKLYYSLSNNGQNSQDGFWLWDGRIALVSKDGNWETSVWVKNLTDEFYITQSYDNTGGIFPSQNFIGEPRTFGVNVQYNF
jgi:iron complex outermembrane receptor protein